MEFAKEEEKEERKSCENDFHLKLEELLDHFSFQLEESLGHFSSI